MVLIGKLSEFIEIDTLFKQASNSIQRDEYDFLSIASLPEKDEEKWFWEQILYKEAPFIKLNSYSKDKPYAYFERNDGTVYLLVAIFTENGQKWIYSSFHNQWKNISINTQNKEAIKFNEKTSYFYTKINKEDLDKDKVNKQLSSEWERGENESKKLPKINFNKEEGKIIISLYKTLRIIINHCWTLSTSIKAIQQEKDKNYEKLVQENQIYKAQIEALNQENQTFKSQLEAAYQKDKTYIAEIEALNQKSQIYKAQIESLSKESQIYKAQIESLNQASQTYKAQNEGLNQKKIKYKAQIEALNQKSQTYKAQIDEALNKKSQNYNDQIEALNQENQIIKSQIKDLNQKCKNYITQIEALNQKNQAYITQIETLNQENQAYKAQIKPLNEENQTIKSLVETLNQDHQSIISQLKSLTQAVGTLRPAKPNPTINYPLIFDRKKSGIPNIGNSCYLNSLLQVLASNNDFCEKIRPTTDELISVLSLLLMNIRNSETKDTEQLVLYFKNAFDREFPWFGNSTQQDSKELMLLLLGKINNIDPLFTIIYKQILNCHICYHKSKITDNYFFITILSNTFSSLQDFIDDLKKPKIYNNSENLMYCEKCEKQQNMTGECEEIIWPSTVTFYLSSKNGSVRINEELNIEGTIYRWYGLICYYGDSQFGHYIAYTWDTKNWTEYNDIRAESKSSGNVDVAHGYLAFYARSGE